MSSAYKFSNPDGVYFLSTATVQWVDVFIRPVYADRLIESLQHCQQQKGLVIHGVVPDEQSSAFDCFQKWQITAGRNHP